MLALCYQGNITQEPVPSRLADADAVWTGKCQTAVCLNLQLRISPMSSSTMSYFRHAGFRDSTKILPAWTIPLSSRVI